MDPVRRRGPGGHRGRPVRPDRHRRTRELGQWGEATTTSRDYATFLAGIPGGVVAKQGWICVADRRQLHSTGVLADDRVAVLLGDFPVRTTWRQTRAALDEAARVLLSGW